jgi:hypothetical protein
VVAVGDATGPSGGATIGPFSVSIHRPHAGSISTSAPTRSSPIRLPSSSSAAPVSAESWAEFGESMSKSMISCRSAPRLPASAL